MPSLGRQGRTHVVEIGAAVRWLLERERADAAVLATTANLDPRIQAARARKYEAGAALRELQLGERKGALVEFSAAQQAVDKCGWVIRERLLTLPSTAVQRASAAPTRT
jgi:phage terminase Nu1 subunit (DNA packaging protein)